MAKTNRHAKCIQICKDKLNEAERTKIVGHLVFKIFFAVVHLVNSDLLFLK